MKHISVLKPSIFNNIFPHGCDDVTMGTRIEVWNSKYEITESDVTP